MFTFGVDYYPEHWPEERWSQDARLMAEASFNIVRLAEFAWSWMEPREGQFDFDWLDRAISILADHDIHVILGTPTASPPPWLMTKNPDVFLVRDDGQRATFGNQDGLRAVARPVDEGVMAGVVGHDAAQPPAVLIEDPQGPFAPRPMVDIDNELPPGHVAADLAHVDRLEMVP